MAVGRGDDLVSAPFPANKQLQWRTWYSGGKDPLGNTVDKWRDPVTVNVIGWSVRTVLARDGISEVEDTDRIRLMIPPTLPWQSKDLVVIPTRGNFLVEGADDSNMGFHNWQPGVTLTLLRQGRQAQSAEAPATVGGES
jgi:hypothetical protein